MIPRAPLILAVLAVIPLAWGVATSQIHGVNVWSLRVLGARFTGPYLQLAWGQIMLAFHAGLLWAHARATPRILPRLLAPLPALWAFVMVTGGPVAASANLIIGLVAMLGLDAAFERWGLMPGWWMALRIPSCIGAVALLGLGAL